MAAIDTIRAGLIPVVASITDEFFPDTITVRQATVTKDASGQQTSTWADDPTLVNVRALIQTIAEYMKRIDTATGLTFTVGDYVITLGSYQTAVGVEDRVLVDDGRVFEVFGVEHDPVSLITRLYCHLSNPGTGT